jgi:hypothetical protein
VRARHPAAGIRTPAAQAIRLLSLRRNVDEQGQSRISMEDYAIALVDELEKPKQERARFTIEY